ncbi:MAG: 23S rRNA (uracil747-C5)-methyltransferase, partial [Shewanella sp.]
MKCDYFERGDCLSCRNIQLPMVEQVSVKQQQLTDLFRGISVKQWLAPILSAESGFRNKAKMVVLGAAHKPILGLVNPK